MACKTLRILHFNDAYQVESTPYFLEQWNARRRGDTLSVFSGDILSPSFASMFLKGEQFVPFLQKLSLDAAVIGNHEFDYGMPQFLDLSQKTRVPWLVCNYKSKETRRSILDLPGSLIKDLDGCRVGVIGIVDQAWEDTVDFDVSGCYLEDPIQACKVETESLKKQGCDFVVVLTHTDMETDLKLLQSDLDIDLILGGHNHVFHAEKFGRKLLVKSGCDFKSFSEILLQTGTANPESTEMSDGVFLDNSTTGSQTLDFNTAKPIGSTQVPLHITFTRHQVDFNGPFDARLKTEVAQILEKLSAKNEVPFAFFEGELDLRSTVIRASECAMADLATDLIRILIDVDVVLIQSGHIRLEKKLPPKHVYRLIDLLNTFPLRDPYSVFAATGKDLHRLMEEGIRPMPQAKGCFPNVSGMSFAFRTSNAPLSRIQQEDITILGNPFEPDRSFSFGVLKWMKEGGDGYHHMTKLPSLPLSRDVCSLEAFKQFLNLPSSASNRDEFKLVKPHLNAYTLDQLLAFRRSGDPAAKTIGCVTPAHIETYLRCIPELIQKLTPEAAERVLMYQLPQGLVVVEDTPVFTFANQADRRVRPIDG